MTGIKKTAIIRVLQVLEEHTDKDHPLIYKEIQEELKKYGLSLDRRAIAAHVKALAEMFREGDSFRVITKRKMGTYIERYTFNDDDIRHLIDLVRSDYSICTEHRMKMCQNLIRFASLGLRQETDLPDSKEKYVLVDPNDDKDFADHKEYRQYDDVEEGVVERIRKAIKDRLVMSFDYSIHFEAEPIKFKGVPITVDIFNQRYYALFFTPHRHFEWIRLDYIGDADRAEKAKYYPTMREFVTGGIKPPDGSPNGDEYFYSVVDGTVCQDEVRAHFDGKVTCQEINEERLFIAAGYSDEYDIEQFAEAFWDTAIVVFPSTYEYGAMTKTRRRLMRYCQKNNLI